MEREKFKMRPGPETEMVGPPGFEPESIAPEATSIPS